MTAYAQTYFRLLLFIDCYLLFIFFVIILKIFTFLLVYVNISCIFTP